MPTAAAEQRTKLLLMTDPLEDGSIHLQDVATLREAGARLRRDESPKKRS